MRMRMKWRWRRTRKSWSWRRTWTSRRINATTLMIYHYWWMIGDPPLMPGPYLWLSMRLWDSLNLNLLKEKEEKFMRTMFVVSLNLEENLNSWNGMKSKWMRKKREKKHMPGQTSKANRMENSSKSNREKKIRLKRTRLKGIRRRKQNKTYWWCVLQKIFGTKCFRLVFGFHVNCWHKFRPWFLFVAISWPCLVLIVLLYADSLL